MKCMVTVLQTIPIKSNQKHELAHSINPTIHVKQHCVCVWPLICPRKGCMVGPETSGHHPMSWVAIIGPIPPCLLYTSLAMWLDTNGYSMSAKLWSNQSPKILQPHLKEATKPSSCSHIKLGISFDVISCSFISLLDECLANALRMGKNVNAMPLSGSILLVILLASIAQKSPICGCKIPISLGCRSWCVLPWTGTDLWCLQSAGEAKLYHFCILLDLFNFQLFVYIYCFYEMTQVEVIVFATIQNLISHFITMISPFYKSVRRGTVLQNSHKVQAAICHKAMMLQKAGRGSNGPNLEIQSGERTLNSFPETCPDSIHHPPLSIPLLSVRPTSPSWWSLSPSSPVQKVFRMRCINTLNLFQSL